MKDGEQPSDTELLLDARSRSEPFSVFYERHFASVLAFFRQRERGPEKAFDLTAETFAAALVALPRFQPGPEPALWKIWQKRVALLSTSSILVRPTTQGTASSSKLPT